jgi:glycosyltransferase involved in cell wall biosynthesis
MPFDMAWVYSTTRANSGLPSVLEQARSSHWELFKLDMDRSINPASDFRNAMKLRAIIRRSAPDIVHCHSSKAGGLGRLALIGLPGRPKLLYSPHAVAARLGAQYIFIERGLSGLTDRFAAVSDSEREEIVHYGIGRKSDIDVVYPSIDTDYFAPASRVEARLRLGICVDTPLVLGIGRLTPQKNPLAFVEIIRRLLSNSPGLQAMWVGDGEMRSGMQNVLRDHALEQKITIAGWQDDVRQYLAASDLLLSTSRYESFGYTVAETLAMERPAVATNVAGTTNIMQQELKGLLYQPDDYDDAARLASGLLSNPQRATVIGLAGRRIVMNEFSKARMIRALNNCYGRLLRPHDETTYTTT